ncbi:MAG: cellulase family glycosylhydrolase, partial [Chthoniobacteraceae bacterium]
TRWFPETKWQFFQPKAGDPFNWHDADFDLAAKYGVSQHVVLYGWPPGLMDKEHSGQPLPLDMKWTADDPRWDDLSIETAWDKFVKAAATHFKGQSVIFEIENEPEFDKWEKHFPEYAKFTIRTAKLIRATDPKAKIMVDNVYGIPSPVNAAFFKAGGLKFIDAVSWHDYHAGWLSDAQGIKRMRQNMDEAGGKHVEIWFNEGWAYTNTAVDEPIACTSFTSAQSTNMHAACVAEMTIAGQEKTILFHTGYEDHGQSFWDYSGPGQMLWDWYGYPLPLVAMWNVLNHHIGVSDEVGFVRPPGANFCIFQDQRNARGVMIAYADRESKEDVTVEVPDLGAPLIAEDIMGNPAPVSMSGRSGGIARTSYRVPLLKSGRPIILYTAAKTSGTVLLAKLESLDRKNASFITTAPGAAPTWRLPPVWEGKAKGENEGSVALADGKPIWKLEQLWPADWKKRENFRPMTWTGTDWNVKEGGFGGQPGAALKDGTLNFGTRAPHGPENDRHLRTAGLTFVAPKAGTYTLHGTVSCRMWDSKNKTTLHLLKKTASAVEKVGALVIEHGGDATLEGQSVELAAGDELTLLPQIDGAFAGGDCELREFSITLGGAKAAASAGYKLPAAWVGTKTGSADGNPIAAAGQSVWRVDGLFPDEPVFAENYRPLVWSGTDWGQPEHGQGGQPSVRVEDGTVNFAVRGPWNGPGLDHQKTAGLIFIAPKSGIYKISATAHSKPWEGGAQTFKLAILKKDTQRAAEVKTFDLPGSGVPVPLALEVELTAGHELVFLPLMPDWNNATNTTIENLTITAAP